MCSDRVPAVFLGYQAIVADGSDYIKEPGAGCCIRRSGRLGICNWTPVKLKNIPISVLDKRINELGEDKNKAFVIVCETGSKSIKAGNLLKKAGYQAMNSLSGGIAGWEKANLPLTTK